MIWVFIFIFFMILCFMLEWYFLGGLCVFLVILFFVILANENVKEKEKREARDIKLKEKEKEQAKQREIQQEFYEEKINSLKTEYGECDKIISLSYKDFYQQIIVFGAVGIVYILGKEYQMKDILSCQLSDNSRIEKGKVTYETSAKGGNMAKRAVTGGLLLGGAGAIIGGATAKTGTVVNQEDDLVIHNFTVLINVNSLSEPIIRIPLKEDEATANNIIALFNVIINRNK